MKHITNKLIILVVIISFGGMAYSQQINIPRVEQMPTVPTPYLMRDWSDVARKYDSLVYNVNKTGTNWPIVKLGTSGNNYPEIKPIFMDTYIGSISHGIQAEAINIIPSIVGATLVGADKSNQYGVNWVESVQDFFNKKNGQNVYLNSSSATSGDDWWYDIMPNVFFYQLYSLYPGVTNFSTQFTSVADAWQKAINKMGGSTTPWNIPNMNYRAWNLSNNTPLTSGVLEPESAGSLSWLMYNAYAWLGDKKYLYTAQMCMDFLNNLTTNPSYEIQLPYGALMAAKMNAELGSTYDVEKMLNWIFNRGPLRDWGTIVGTWNGNSVSGLIGEANDAGNDYAFVMNGFQQAAALVPLAKYDKRFARAIAKWTLNVANASRLFYTPYLPQDHQDSYDWNIQNDPNAVIAHESLKQLWNGVSLFARGDAIQGGWASTNLSLYSSSHVGYLGAIINKTDVDGIISLDLNKTDFFGNHTYPSYLIYNPFNTAKNITINLGAGNYDIYDAITEKVIILGATGNTSISVGTDSVRILVYLPQGTSLAEKNGKLYAGRNVVDYHYKYNFAGLFRIKSLTAQKSMILTNDKDTVFCTVDNAPSSVQYNWAVNGVAISAATGSTLSWASPASEGTYKISCKVSSSGGFEATDSVFVKVISVIPVNPKITGLNGSKKFYNINDTAGLTCSATDVNGAALTYLWSKDSGIFLESNTTSVRWVAPASEGVFKLSCHVTNSFGLFSDTSIYVLVKDKSIADAGPLIYYPFDGDVKDYSGNGYDAFLSGAVSSSDALDRANWAYKFSTSTDLIYTANKPELNFQDKITISFWLKLDQVTEESFIVSHGSWEERYKVSVTPDKKLRWTIKTDQATKDLDNSATLALNTFYHFTVAYTGYSLEIYVNGDLDVFAPMTGKIQQTTKDLTIGHKDVSTKSYYLRGTVDEIRIYNAELPVAQIKMLPTTWNLTTGVNSLHTGNLSVYPNPSNGFVFIEQSDSENPPVIEAFDLTGRKLHILGKQFDSKTLRIEMTYQCHGLVIFKLQYQNSQKYCKVLFQ